MSPLVEPPISLSVSLGPNHEFTSHLTWAQCSFMSLVISLLLLLVTSVLSPEVSSFTHGVLCVFIAYLYRILTLGFPADIRESYPFITTDLRYAWRWSITDGVNARGLFTDLILSQRAAAPDANYHRRYHNFEMARSCLQFDLYPIHRERLHRLQYLGLRSRTRWLEMGL